MQMEVKGIKIEIRGSFDGSKSDLCGFGSASLASAWKWHPQKRTLTGDNLMTPYDTFLRRLNLQQIDWLKKHP